MGEVDGPLELEKGETGGCLKEGGQTVGCCGCCWGGGGGGGLGGFGVQDC